MLYQFTAPFTATYPDIVIEDRGVLVASEGELVDFPEGRQPSDGWWVAVADSKAGKRKPNPPSDPPADPPADDPALD